LGDERLRPHGPARQNMARKKGRASSPTVTGANGDYPGKRKAG
jgi:hypothetical protein